MIWPFLWCSGPDSGGDFERVIREELAILHPAGTWTLEHAACTTWSKRRWLQMGRQARKKPRKCFLYPREVRPRWLRRLRPLWGPRMFLQYRPFGSHLMSQQMSLVMPMRHSPALPHLFFRARDPIIQEADECFVVAQSGALGCPQKLQKDHSWQTWRAPTGNTVSYVS